MKRLILVLGLVLIFIGSELLLKPGFLSGLQKTLASPDASTPTTIATPSLQQLFCTHTERYPNTPEVQRAFDLIENSYKNKQLTTTNQKGEMVTLYTYWHQIIPCVEVIFKNIEGGAEGYVTFSHDDIKPNHYPIYVDDSYKHTPDIILALLLSCFVSEPVRQSREKN
jgi:hypothetical protein